MARLLRDEDYLAQIQADNLDQLIESTDSFRLEKEQAAQAEMISYLSQRYIVDEIFTDTTVFNVANTYLGKNLIEYTAPLYDESTVYVTDNRIVFEKNIYNSIAGSPAEVFDPAKWTLIAADLSLYFAKLPEQEYNNKTTYEVGEKVWYKDAVYTAITQAVGLIPSDNEANWGVGVPFSFSGNLPDDIAFWTKGDNRNPLIVMFLIDVTLNHLYSRINPRNIPDLRKERYNGNDPMDRGGAIGWLKKVAGGDINADLPEILHSQGVAIMGGSIPKRTNLPDNW